MWSRNVLRLCRVGGLASFHIRPREPALGKQRQVAHSAPKTRERPHPREPRRQLPQRAVTRAQVLGVKAKGAGASGRPADVPAGREVRDESRPGRARVPATPRGPSHGPGAEGAPAGSGTRGQRTVDPGGCKSRCPGLISRTRRRPGPGRPPQSPLRWSTDEFPPDGDLGAPYQPHPHIHR